MDGLSSARRSQSEEGVPGNVGKTTAVGLAVVVAVPATVAVQVAQLTVAVDVAVGLTSDSGHPEVALLLGPGVNVAVLVLLGIGTTGGVSVGRSMKVGVSLGVGSGVAVPLGPGVFVGVMAVWVGVLICAGAKSAKVTPIKLPLMMASADSSAMSISPDEAWKEDIPLGIGGNIVTRSNEAITKVK